MSFTQILRTLSKLAKYALCTALLGVSADAAAWDKNEFVKFDKNKGAGMKVLIIGANGSVAKWAIEGFLQGTSVDLRLFLRNASRLNAVAKANPQRVQLIEGDATDTAALKEAMSEAGVRRLVWVSSYGVHQDEYAEIPGRNAGAISSMLRPYADSVRLIKASGLDYTIIRPQWFSNADEIDYELTRKGEAFKNPDALISRKSIAHLIIRLCLEQGFGVRESLGINKPAR